ncbi:hypothetical protein [Proteus vulgaris]|uniref:hypothetical protein n=1 Tax=Proteus vulgaris TaxID=585 RepID=UPI000C9FB158|nr:hypothetical protein [Proteus vulgaris]UBH60419.1 hypothetical protein LA322_09765 [Proteus vulgaris]VTP85859.1 Uncharacterised protein [Proteus vulgaris]
MKQVFIIAGGLLSLTIMLAIFIAILMVSVFKETTAEIWNKGREVIESSSSKMSETISTVEAKRDTFMAVYRSKENNGSCQQLAQKLNEVESGLSNGSLILPRSAVEQISTIKNAFDKSTSSTRNIACKQAIQVIDNLSQ